MTLTIHVGLIVALAVAAPAAGVGPVIAAERPAACSTIGGPPRRLELPDGRIVSLDVRSIAQSGGAVFAAGRHGYVFPRDARSRTSPTMVDSILGVHIDARGEVSIVLNPLLPRRAFHPRVAAAPNGSFHVVFATGLAGVDGRSQTRETITLWHATYTRGWWSRPIRVGQFAGAILDPELSSALLERDGTLSLAFPFTDDRSPATNGGAIMLRHLGDRWIPDTLRTYRTPAAVNAIHDDDGTLLTLLSLAQPNPDKYREQLFVARFDTGWVQPRHVAGDGVRHITISELKRTKARFLVSWIDWPYDQPESAQLRWVTLDRDLRPHVQPIVGSGSIVFPFTMVVVDGERALWMYHNEPFGGSVKLVIGTDSGTRTLPSLDAPFTNPLASALAVSANRFLVFTQKRAEADHEPMAASYMTALDIRCPRTEQR